jgi:hypothetical protein
MRKRTARILTGLGIAVVAVSLIYAIAVAVSAVRLRQAYAALEKDGRPMRAADIIPPEVPDTENAALLYESAALLLKGQPAGKRSLLERLGDISGSLRQEPTEPEMIAKRQQELAEFRQLIQQDVVSQALSIIQQGTHRPACRFERAYDRGLPMNPYLGDLRHLIFILWAKARLEAEAGQPTLAWELAQTQLKFADALRQEPVFISQVLRMGMIQGSCATIQRLCEALTPDEQQSQTLSDLLGALDDIRPLMLAADGERLLVGEWAFSLPKNELNKALWDWTSNAGHGARLTKHLFDVTRSGPNEHVSEVLHRIWFIRTTFKPAFLADHATYLRLANENTRLIGRPYSSEERQHSDEECSRITKHHVLTNILMPALGAIREAHCRATAMMRITRAGLALLQYKQAHGAFPSTLDAIALANLSDPFSEKPLLYRVEGDGFVVYSVGPDQKDNNGATPQRPGQKTDCDIVWRYPNPDVQ